MAQLHLIVAHARNKTIGQNGTMPWYLPEDLKHFKRTTIGKPVIMGRKTWQSLPKALPGRTNIVITRQADFSAEGATVVHTIDEAIELVKAEPVAFIIGGAELYRQTMPLVSVAHITHINADFDGDAVFDAFDEADWLLVDEENHPATDSHPFSYSFRRYEKK